MVVDQNYDVSMKVTNITSNPLDAELTDFSITSPDGNVTSASEVTENTIIWKNIPYKDDNNYQAWELRNCGVSCTISEFMVTPANTNDGVYEAYSGTKMDVVFPPLTKNICPPPIKGVSIDGQTGAETTSVTRATTDFIPVDFSTNTNYRFSGMPNTLTMWANAYNADKVSLGRTTSSKRTKYTISASSFGEGAPQGTGDIAYVRLTFSAGSGASIDDVDSSNIQLETGNSETSYEPYCNSVFGGSLDLITGVLTITNGVIASYNGETLPSVWVSDRDVYAQGTSPTTGAQVVYELATPVTVQLTPTQVAAFVGKNTIWTNTSGNITVAY
jgi:hypothetical protein